MPKQKQSKKTLVSLNDRLLFSPEEAAQLLGLGRTKLYQLILQPDPETGEPPLYSVFVKGQRKISKDSITEFISNLPTTKPKGVPKTV
jgi:hypothetical protein